MDGSRIIYTLGTSNRTLEEFFDVLEAFQLREIADVRRFPTSHRYPWFNRESLDVALGSKGLGYRWLGDLLGGFREGGYEVYKTEIGYLRGLEEVERIAITRQVVLICAERLPWKCHRMLIATSLKQRGWDVVHILEKDRTWQQKQEVFDFESAHLGEPEE